VGKGRGKCGGNCVYLPGGIDAPGTAYVNVLILISDNRFIVTITEAYST
jgi:hypothetical protein